MPNIQESITSERTLAMLRTAMGADIAGAFKVIEIMLNPDGHIWVDQIGKGRFDTDKSLTPREAERVVRLVASHINQDVTPKSPIISAELPVSKDGSFQSLRMARGANALKA